MLADVPIAEALDEPEPLLCVGSFRPNKGFEKEGRRE
jgi:hypothetical protein